MLVGGGDPTLAAGPPPPGRLPAARDASRAGRGHRQGAARPATAARSRLGYDASLFAGPDLGPGWPPSYVTTGNVTPITALEVDQGRLTTDGQPQDADDPGNFRPRSLTPAADAARAFAGFLQQGRHHRARPGRSPLPRGPARPRSPACRRRRWPQIVQWMLIESNNVIAENLARQVAIATGTGPPRSAAPRPR